MTEARSRNVRRILTEVVILATAIGASYGAVEVLRYAFDLPVTRAPLLPIIVLAIVMARVASIGWLQKVLTKRS
jgi:hypothetical protein